MAQRLRDRLLTGLDKENNVVNPQIVADVLSQLDNIQITKEELEATRLGKHINELRKRTSDKQIGSRAKSLIKKWRNTFVQNPTGPAASQPPPQSVNNHVQNAQHQNVSSKSNGQEPPPGGGNGLLRHKQAAAISRATSGSLPSSASTSPALPSSRPGTPGGGLPVIHKRTSPPASQQNQGPPARSNGTSLVNGNASSLKRPRPGLGNSLDDDDEEIDVVEVQPNAKRARLVNGHHAGENSAAAATSRKANHCDNSSSQAPTQSNNHHLNNRQQSKQVNKQNPSNTSVISKTNNAERPTPGRRKSSAAGGGAGGVGGGRGGGSGGLDGHGVALNEGTDLLKRQMQSVQSVKRVKTTQELVQELAMRTTTSPGLQHRSGHSGGGEVNQSQKQHQQPVASEETREELMNRFFDSQNGSLNSSSTTGGGNKKLSEAASDAISPPTSLGVPSPPSLVTSQSRPKHDVTAANSHDLSGSDRPETVEDVLSRLPPVNVEAVLAQMEVEAEDQPDSDDDVDIPGLIPVKRPEPAAVTSSDVRRFNDEPTESFNGNFGHDGDFKEWHEVVSKTTLGGDLIHILPYSVID